MLETGRYLYVGFMCHQSIEKILKAFITEKVTEDAPFVHSLDYLSKKSDLKQVMNAEQLEELFTLEPMNIETRYPTYKENLLKLLTPKFCEKLIKETKELQSWIKKQL